MCLSLCAAQAAWADGNPPLMEACVPIDVQNPPLAFEGAMGYGAYAWWGAPSQIPSYDVTSGADYNPYTYPPETPIANTLRYAIMQFSGPIIVNVKYNGEINLKAPLAINTRSYVKVSGEQATGAGPTITGDEFQVFSSKHIILRYLRFRSAVSSNYHCNRSLNIFGGDTSCSDIIVDRCSIGESRDDNLSISGNICRLTIQNCIIGGASGTFAVGSSKAGIGSSGGDHVANPDETITFCRNLIGNTYGRQMAFTGPGRVDFVNNVVGVYIRCTELWCDDRIHGPKINILNNYYQTANAYIQTRYFEDPIRAFVTSQSPGFSGQLVVSGNENSIHVGGNVFKRYDVNNGVYVEPYTSQWDFTFDALGGTGGTPNFPTSLQKTDPWTMPSNMVVLSASAALSNVVANAGCRMPLSNPQLDAYDSDSLADMQDGTKTFVDYGPLTDENAGTPENPDPGNNSMNVPINVDLVWSSTDETDSYDIYLDTHSNPTTKIGSVSSSGHPAWPLTNLQPNTDYYWLIVAKNECDTSQNSEWHFKTAP